MSKTSSPTLSIGQQLREARLQQKLKIPDIAVQLCIKPEYLKAMEADQFDTLPDGVYRRAFVRSYAQHLGLSDAVQEATLPQTKKTPLGLGLRAFDTPSQDVFTGMPSRLILFISLLLVGLVAAVWWFGFAAKDSAKALFIPTAPQAVEDVADDLSAMVRSIAVLGREVARPPEDALRPEALLDEFNQSEAGVATDAAVAKPVAAIQLRAQAETFVEIRNAAGGIVFEKVMQAGESFAVPDQPDLTLLTGNAGGLVFILEGEDMGVFGANEAIRRIEGLSLDAIRQAYQETITEDEATPNE